jgi:WD40 repeat protein
MIATSENRTPYKGLIPYSEEDADFFFGRDHEQNIITANLISERLTLLYGASGVGKSSVLRAGVEHHLRQLAQQNIKRLNKPKYVVVVFNEWRDIDPVGSLLARVEKSVRLTLKGQAIEPVAETLPLTEALMEWAKRVKGQLLIILDQFEEYFLYHQNEDGKGTFAEEFPRAVNSSGVPANFLVSFREDALAKLDFFKVRMPTVFGNFLRIEHLSHDGGVKAIKEPLNRYNEENKNNGRDGAHYKEVSIKDDLVEEVLKQVKVGEKLIGDSGLGGIETQAAPVDSHWQIETPYLQLVMTRLWEEEMRQQSQQQNAGQPDTLYLRLETLNKLRGAKHIVQTHLDNVMRGLSRSERALGAQIFKFLVTPSGTKIAQTVDDLAGYARLSSSQKNQLAAMMEALSSGDKRILRAVPSPANQKDSARYEVFHDVLAQAILDWRRRYSERQRYYRLALSAAGMALLLLFMTGLTVYAFNQKKEADRQRNEANRQTKLAEALLKQVQAEKINVELQKVEADKAKEAAEQQKDNAETARQKAEYASQEAAKQRDIAVKQRKATVEATKQLAARNTALVRTKGDLETAKSELISKNEELKTQTKTTQEALEQAETLLSTIHEIDSSNAYYKAVLRGPKSKVTYAALSKDAKKVLTTSDDGSAEIWDVSQQKSLYKWSEINKGYSPPPTISPYGRYVAIAKNDVGGATGYFSIWDVDSAEPKEVASRVINDSRNIPMAIDSQQFSPDGTLFLAVGNGATAKVWRWDAAEGKLSKDPISLGNGVHEAAFSRDSSMVVTVSGTVMEVWNARTGEKIQVITEGNAWFTNAEFSPSGKYIVSTGRGYAQVWETLTGKLQAQFKLTNPAIAAALSPDDKYLVTATAVEEKAFIWDIETQQLFKELTGHTGVITGVRFSPDGKYIVTSSADKTARVWDSNGKPIAELRGHTGAVNTAYFDEKSRYVVTSSDDKTARVWDISGEASKISSGTKAINVQAAFDLDTGQTSTGEADVAWTISTDGKGTTTMSALNGARIVDMGRPDFSSITITQLQGLNYNNSPLEVYDGVVFAVLTSKSNYAKVRVRGYGESREIIWVTYLNVRNISITATAILDKLRDSLADPARKNIATQRLQKIVSALEKNKDAAMVLKAAGISSAETDGLKLRSALIVIRRGATENNNSDLLGTVDQAIVDYGGASSVVYYEANSVGALSDLAAMSRREEVLKVAKIVSMRVETLGETKVTAVTYSDVEDLDYATSLGRLVLVEYTNENDAQSQIATRRALGETFLFNGEVYVRGRLAKVLAFRTRQSEK